MSVLIMHHLEEIWDKALRNHGTSFDQMVEKVAEHLEENDYSLVILTKFEGIQFDEGHFPIAHHINVVHEYAYGWEREQVEQYGWEEGVAYCDGGTHSEVVLLDEWMKHLPKEDVHIAGAFDGECIDDLETALDFLEVNYNRIESLIV